MEKGEFVGRRWKRSIIQYLKFKSIRFQRTANGLISDELMLENGALGA
jgi:hypothetical protein